VTEPCVPTPLAGADRVRTAVLLAAGTGSRLSSGSESPHKCLTEVNGVPILQQQLRALEHWHFEHLIVVVGHEQAQIRDFLDASGTSLAVTYVENPRYDTTNNLVSLWYARNTMTQPFLLLECDLVFDPELLTEMLHPDRIAVARYAPWMRGTTVTLTASQHVAAFHAPQRIAHRVPAHKTVNIYSFSLSAWRRVAHRLESHVADGHLQEYYETVFRDMTADGTLRLQAVSFDAGRWYEIDTREDVHLAERLFAPTALGGARG
jgi:choline kinase